MQPRKGVMSSHGLFAQDNPFSSGGGEDTGSCESVLHEYRFAVLTVFISTYLVHKLHT